MPPMKRPLQLHRKTRRQAACCGWNGAVGFNVAQPGVFSWRGGSTAPAEVKEMEAKKLNLWWFLCAKTLVGWDFHWTSNVHFQSAEGWQRWYIHLQNSWRWGALAQFSWQMLLAMLYRCFSDTPTVCVSASLKSSNSNGLYQELLGPPSHVETWGQTGDRRVSQGHLGPVDTSRRSSKGMMNFTNVNVNNMMLAIYQHLSTIPKRNSR